MPEFIAKYSERVDVVIVYSVLHYVFDGADLFGFLDAAASLLAEGGHLLLGDIPNVSKRKRFFSSPAGVDFHRRFMETDNAPTVRHLGLEPTRIDDAVVIAILLRYRLAGFETYLLPQSGELPIHNRREDVLIVRP
jgi:hypothetical protein